jgi:hypothetical protein
MSSSTYNSTKKYFRNCKLSVHWEEKCWKFHLKIYPRSHIGKRRVWGVKGKEDEEFPTYLQPKEQKLSKEL